MIASIHIVGGLKLFSVTQQHTALIWKEREEREEREGERGREGKGRNKEEGGNGREGGE